MSEGPAAVAESHSALLKDTKYALVALEDNSDHVEGKRVSSEDEDFVVYSGSTDLKQAPDISHKFESQSTNNSRPEDRSEIRIERHEIQLEATDDETSGDASLKLVDAMRGRSQSTHEEAVNSFQDVPLLQGNSDGLFFNGLVFCDTVDSLYRPVVVINTRAIPHKSLRTAALRHLREALEPVVSTGPYVLVFTSFASSSLSKLPASWVLAAYRELSFPFRKNVQHVILVRPNKFLKAFIKLMKMVVKKKSHSKIKEVLYLGEIEQVTNGEVTLEHLSPKVIRALGHEELAYSDFSIPL